MPDDPKTPFHNPFGALGDLRDRLPGGPPAGSPPAEPAREVPPRTLPRAVVRLERAGRHGKVVTVVEQLTLRPDERGEWLGALKASLGTGGTVEGETLVIHGDQRKRLQALLSARGVKKVTVG
jgi:translation initiation factor 1